MAINYNPEESLLDLALEVVANSKEGLPLDKIRDQVFEIKGFSKKTSLAQAALFEADFMISGYFVVCGANNNGDKIWDLKRRRETALLDKPGTQAFFDEEEQKEIEENELSEENIEKNAPITENDDIADSDKTIADLAANTSDTKPVKSRVIIDDSDEDSDLDSDREKEAKDDIEKALEDDEDILPEDSYDDDDENR